MIYAIVFDMDGVLFDTERVGNSVWRQAAQEMQFSAIDRAIADCCGLNRTDTQTYFQTEFPAFAYAHFYERTHDLMRERLAEGMPVKLGAYALLQWLKEQQWRIGLATSTSLESTMHHLNSAGMATFFDKIVTGEHVTHGKPNPEIYQIACAELGVSPETTVAVEDSPNGIRSAFDANMRVIMVPDLIAPNWELRRMLTAVAENLFDVQELLKQFC